jgi:hypothetical protein
MESLSLTDESRQLKFHIDLWSYGLLVAYGKEQ